MVLHITRFCNNGEETYMQCASMGDKYMRLFNLDYYELFYDLWCDEVHQKIWQEILQNPSLYKDGLWYEYEVHLEETNKAIYIQFKDYYIECSLILI